MMKGNNKNTTNTASASAINTANNTATTNHRHQPKLQQAIQKRNKRKDKNIIVELFHNIMISLYDKLFPQQKQNRKATINTLSSSSSSTSSSVFSIRILYYICIIISFIFILFYYSVIISIIDPTSDQTNNTNVTTQSIMQRLFPNNYKIKFSYIFMQLIVTIPILILCYYEFYSLYDLYRKYNNHNMKHKNQTNQNKQNINTNNIDYNILYMIEIVQYHMIPLSLLLCIISKQLLPTSISNGIVVITLVVSSLMTIPLNILSTSKNNNNNNNNNNQISLSSISSNTTAFSIFLMILVLLIENFLIWVVSATYELGYQSHDIPLQDNGQIVLQKYILSNISKSDIIHLRHNMNVQWCLVSCLGTCFIVIDIMNQFHKKYHQYYINNTSSNVHHTRRDRTLYSIGTHGVMTIVIARLIRTIAFSITVLPSQIDLCYKQRFTSYIPPPSIYTFEFIIIGLLPRSSGGCNDLIISGHAVITSTLTCIISSTILYYTTFNDKHQLIINIHNENNNNNTKRNHNHYTIQIFIITIWYLLIFDYLIEIYEGFHYSVDMWLGLVIVILIWIALEPIEKLNEPKLVSVSTTTSSSLLSTETKTIIDSSVPYESIMTNTTTAPTNTNSDVVDTTTSLPSSSLSNSNLVNNNIDTLSKNNYYAHSNTNEDGVLSIKHIIIYAIPAFVSYLQVIVLPNSISNIVIALYTFILIILNWSATKMKNDTTPATTKKNDDESSLVSQTTKTSSSLPFLKNCSRELVLHYSQHLMFCLLYMALGVYL